VSKLINVGDTLVTETFMGDTYYKITRVTKSLAMSIRDSDGYEYKFKRLIGHDMAHPYSQYNTTKYTVIKL
jgi:hypothetical protein